METSQKSYTCQLNIIATKSGIPMKFEKHPTISTGAVLHFGHKSYEAAESSIKRSRTVVSERAFLDYQSGINNYSESMEEKRSSPISLLHNLAQKLNKKIDVNYSDQYFDPPFRGFKCSVTFGDFNAECTASSKKIAREKAFENILSKIDNNESELSATQSSSLDYSLDSTQSSDKSSSDPSELTPRPYQEEIYEKAISNNVIVCLGTGTGKTFIAILLIRKYASETFGPLPMAKRIVFLAPTTALVQQQGDYILKHTNFKVGVFYGDLPFSTWSPTQWSDLFKELNIIVMTPEVCRQLMLHCILSMSNINLLIFDECHHGINSGHPYNVIMTLYYDSNQQSSDLPRIIGLTASPGLNCKLDYGFCCQVIKDRIEKLEKIFNSTCVTASEYIDSLKACRSNPHINIVLYKNQKPSSLTLTLLDYIKDYEIRFKNFCDTFIVDENIILNDNDQLEFSLNETESFFEPVEKTPIFKNLAKIQKYGHRTISRCSLVLLHLGVYPLYLHLKSVQFYFQDLLLKKKCEKYSSLIRKLEKYIGKLLQLVDSKVKKIIDDTPRKTMKDLSESDLVTDKLRVLITTLCSHYTLDKDGPNIQLLPTTLVFCKERTACSVLSQTLNALAAIESNFMQIEPRFLCNFIVGVSSMDMNKKLCCGILSINLKTINSRIEAFHLGSFKILFATNVLEEGIDVQSCNIVIRFDKFNTLHSFIQSKGRIRQSLASFYIITEEENAAEMKFKVATFSSVEHSLENILKRYNIEKVEDKNFDHIISQLPLDQQIFKTPQTQIDLRGCVSYIYRYCGTFSRLAQYSVRPRFFYEHSLNNVKAYLHLPRKNCIYPKLSSDWLDNSDLAKRQVSLRAIKFLYDHGIIDDFLVPIFPKSNIKSPLHFSKSSGELLSTKTTDSKSVSRNNYYLKSIPSALQCESLDKEWNLYSVTFTNYSVCESREAFYAKIDLSNSDICFILPGKHPPVSFPLASSSQSVQITVSQLNENSVTFSSNVLELLIEFNRLLFINFLKIVPMFCGWNPEKARCKLFVGLLKNNQVDFNKMEELISFFKKFVSKNLKDYISASSIPEPQHTSLVVTKNYSNDSTLYAVLESSEVTPDCLIPNLKRSYKNYYLEKWKLNISPGEIMLSCFPFMRECNMLHRVNMHKIKNHGCIYLPSSHVIAVPLTSCLIMKFKMVPSIIKRLIDFYCVYEWCEDKLDVSSLDAVTLTSLKQFCSVSIPRNSNLVLNKEPNSLSSFEKFFILLDSYWNENSKDHKIMFDSVFSAFTRVSTTECCDYERMETLGDSFIKLISTMYLFSSNPNLNEGNLSFQREAIISNNNLFLLGRKLGIKKIVNSKPIIFGKNWCPPLCVVESEQFLSESPNDVIEHQFIADKVIADVVESLIGCCFISSNMSHLYKFLINIGLLNDSTSDIKFKSFEELTNSCKKIKFNYPNIEPLFFDISNVEKIINYQFKTKTIIAQAITHPSAITHPEQDDYEKLELLGDAVMGFIIVIYLYLCHDDIQSACLSPFLISRLSHLLVCNKSLGILAARKGLLKCMQLRSFPLHSSISRFLSSLESADVQDSFQEVPFLGLICKPQQIEDAIKKSVTIELVPCPKPTGDLFESIVGAVFVDSGCDIVLTAKIFLPFFRDNIEKYLVDFPIHPKIFVVEKNINLVKEVIKLDDLRFKAVIRKEDDTFEYIGIANNSEDSYIAACYALIKYGNFT